MPPRDWDPEWSRLADKIVGQSETHARALQGTLPDLNGRVSWVGSGVRMELFEKLDGTVERNPKKMIWASDPARGLSETLLPMWMILKRFVPDAELHIFYGWHVTDGLIAGQDKVKAMRLDQLKRDTEAQLDQPGVYWHGRVGQEELYSEWLSSGIWPYWTDFPEVCCIAALEAQCGGAIPITNPWWALQENVDYGALVNGSPTGSVAVQDEYIEVTTFMLNNPEVQEMFRQEMMPAVRERFSWDAVQKRWEDVILT
jgi:glycosyltransferase involved in cell wall biosynthesis